MRKSLLITVLLLAISFIGISQEWHGISSDSPVGMKKTLVSSTENEIVVDVQIGGFYFNSVDTPNGKQFVVSVDKMVSMLEAGAPDLPMEAIPAIIGDNAEMTVSVVKSSYVDIENVEIAPSKGNFSRQINPEDVPYKYGEMYGQNAFYPSTPAYLEAPYILRDFRGQNIMVRPFAYNAVTKTLRVYTKMTIAMTKVSDKGENQKLVRRSNEIKSCSEFVSTYQRHFINFAEANEKYTFTVDNGTMVVISADQFADAMQPLVDWKNISGRPCTLVRLSEIGGNNETQIKNYIMDQYTNNNLAFVLLVGDYTHLTPHSMNGGRSDNWFAMLDGTDYYTEAFVGRFSCESVADAETQVAKVLYYERDMEAGLTWVNKGLGIGANEGAGNGHNGGEADYVHIDYIRDTLLGYTYEQVSQQYSGVGAGTSAAAISSDLNAGVSIVNYCNHGSPTSWAVANYSNTHVNALENDNKLPFIISVACNNGQFDVTCFGEAWLRATNNSTGVPTGALGGMFSWISQPWTPPMTGQDEMVDIMCEHINAENFRHTIGGLAENGNMKILDAHPSDAGDTHNTWIFFGDPSVMMRTDNPVEMTVSVNPGALMLGMTSAIVSTDATFGVATLSLNGEVIASADIVDGDAELEFEPLSTVGTATLVVMGYNKVTYIGEVEIVPAEGPYMTVFNYTPTNVPVNEEQTMSMTFKNVGVEATQGTTNVVVSSTDSNITFIDNEGSFASVPANETVTLTNEFAFTIAEGVEDGTKIQINVTMTCGSTEWTGKAVLTVGTPIIVFDSFQFAGSYVPGESQTVVANFKNVGHYMATNAVVTASSTSEYVTIENNTFEIGTVDPEGFGTALFTVAIDASCDPTEVIPLEFVFTADNGVETTGNGSLKNSCNVIFNMNDSYGDGWNGAKLVVEFDNGSPSQDLTMTSGSTASYTLEITIGVHVTVKFVGGSYNSECSFNIKYDDGTLIYESSGTPVAGVQCEFDVNCGGTPTTLAPVENLEASVDYNTVTLTWNAPAEGTPDSYIVKRNGVKVGEVTELTFVESELPDAIYNYLVIAKYASGESIPVPVTVEVNVASVDENVLTFGVYPNPAENVLNIVSNANSFEYQLVNNLGQTVTTGVANGNAQINVSSIENGIYFLKIVADGNTKVVKVTVK
ncbi:MAG: C25 family cysteine peptidase [Candidatus Limimorpha sp.]